MDPIVTPAVTLAVLVEIAGGAVVLMTAVCGVVWKRLNRVETNLTTSLSTRSRELYAKMEDIRVLVASTNGNVHGQQIRLDAHEKHDREIHAGLQKDIGRLDADLRAVRP